MALRLGLRLGLECSVCAQYYGDQPDTPVSVALFGAVPYVVCCQCLQSVPPSVERDAAYRRRYRVAFFERFGCCVREPPSLRAP